MIFSTLRELSHLHVIKRLKRFVSIGAMEIAVPSSIVTEIPSGAEALCPSHLSS